MANAWEEYKKRNGLGKSESGGGNAWNQYKSTDSYRSNRIQRQQERQAKQSQNQVEAAA